VLRYYNRMSYSQVANVLNLPMSAVRIRIFRAKRSLRCHLRRPQRADTLARLNAERKPERKADALAFKSFKRFNASVSADIGTFYPLSA
jgi:hypothetical protein